MTQPKVPTRVVAAQHSPTHTPIEGPVAPPRLQHPHTEVGQQHQPHDGEQQQRHRGADGKGNQNRIGKV
jgi:hypothetical protein